MLLPSRQMRHTLSTVDETSAGKSYIVAPDVYGMRIVMVNVFFIGTPANWALIDAGLYFSADRIEHAAAELFGEGSRPASIVLTHGHFDHVGSLRELLRRWNVPVYAHRLELPYLTGRSSYPPPDPGVGRGAMAILSPLYPRGPFDAGSAVRRLAGDGSVPGLPGWRAIETPGHTPGHVSLFRDSDRTLIAGDAFVTTKQESLMAVLTQRQEIHGPPSYFTPDWESAELSVRRLADLEPEVAACGHGIPMRGDELRRGLRHLANNFRAAAIPRWGRYVGRPARADESGVVSVPARKFTPAHAAAGAIGLAAVAWSVSRRRSAMKPWRR
jgi:glyoxylase-like metal-dependent hydrolase (beta-lactamase superfamily II)